MSGAIEGVGVALHGAAQWSAGIAAEVGASPWPVSLTVVLVGAGVLLAGARPRRPVAALGAAGVAATAAVILGAPVARGMAVSPSVLAVIAAALAGALSVLVPVAFPALAGALPGALLGDLLAPADRRLEALAAGAILGAVAGFFLARLVASTVAASVGALAVTVGAVGGLHATVAGRAMLAHPLSLLAATVVLAVAGAAFQYPRAWGRGAVEGAGGREPPGRGRAGPAGPANER